MKNIFSLILLEYSLSYKICSALVWWHERTAGVCLNLHMIRNCDAGKIL